MEGKEQKYPTGHQRPHPLGLYWCLKYILRALVDLVLNAFESRCLLPALQETLRTLSVRLPNTLGFFAPPWPSLNRRLAPLILAGFLSEHLSGPLTSHS